LAGEQLRIRIKNDYTNHAKERDRLGRITRIRKGLTAEKGGNGGCAKGLNELMPIPNNGTN
jgi:hypothetical protein